MCVFQEEFFYEASSAYEIHMYHIQPPDTSNTQAVRVIFEDFEVELTETFGLEQRFTMEVTDKSAESFPYYFTFSLLSTTTDVRLSCMRRLNADDNLTPNCVFQFGDV